eukprot:TRINITY_DN10094_c0_g1_i5.p1 TRINITY_DN10094_c0_g1~~TRINITY_DN10094_c0_g1_i5.p1  ORF type:complete len:177 (+),score=36.51 TRINITY_DN10094_c0_g1_i5:274-804(+)
MSPAAMQQRNQARTVLTTSISVMPIKAQEEWLRELCKKWRIQVSHIVRKEDPPKVGGGVGKDAMSTKSGDTVTETLLDVLSSKLGAIMFRRNYNNNSDGQRRQSTSTRSNAAGGGGGMSESSRGNGFFPTTPGVNEDIGVSGGGVVEDDKGDDGAHTLVDSFNGCLLYTSPSPRDS